MNVATATCATSGLSVEWHSIDWSKCHQQVIKLQARIVKATQEGRWGKVKSLQWLLTHSFSGKAIAVKRVTENQGKKTSGVDGVTWSTPQSKSKAIFALKRRGYQPLPLRRVYIPKSNGKERPLGIPTMKDRAMQALYKLALEPVAETTADPNSYGFRPERSTADAREQCFTLLSRSFSPQWILEGDIKGCFDNISHQWMIENIPMDKSILQKWLKAGYVYQNQLYPTEAGTPQGGIISPTLSNLTLDGLEAVLKNRYGRSSTGRSCHITAAKHQVKLVRYADDFIITGRSKELLENEVMPLVSDFLRERGLMLSEEKTKITHIDNGFDFLGWSVRKYKGKLLIKPSKKNVKSFLDGIRATIKANKQAQQIHLIKMLNPKIRGWANYHKGAVSKRTFTLVDTEIWKTIWRWAKRRHQKKQSEWIKNKYFSPTGNRNWEFNAVYSTSTGESRRVKLRYASDTAIRRHIKIKMDANPYDPNWETYFESRLGLKMKDNPHGRRKLISLWLIQAGNCSICAQKISKETGWCVHHITPKSKGGKDNQLNLLLIHPSCLTKFQAKRNKW